MLSHLKTNFPLNETWYKGCRVTFSLKCLILAFGVPHHKVSNQTKPNHTTYISKASKSNQTKHNDALILSSVKVSPPGGRGGMVVKWCRGLMGRDNPPCFDEPTTRGSSQDLYTSASQGLYISASYTSASQDLYTSASEAKEHSGEKSNKPSLCLFSCQRAPDVHGPSIGANVRTHCEM